MSDKEELKELDIKTSYTAADTIPVKMLFDKDLLRATRNGKIIPVHAQIIITNRCNLNCPICSCSERDKNQEMSLSDAFKIINLLKQEGCKSVTITGGGSPLMHPDFEAIVDAFHRNKIKIGLVTNGLLLSKVSTGTLNKLTWCRISNTDFRSFTEGYDAMLDAVVNRAKKVDWAFSHVVSNTPNMPEICEVIDFANRHNFTHVRLVADLFEPSAIDMDELKRTLCEKGIDDKLVIYQGRKEHTRGGNCYICYLKPLIGPDCNIYGCCGVQYCLATPSRDLPKELCLGSAFDLKEILANSHKPLNGNICVKCYYSNYNTLLKGMISKVNHKEFV